MTALLMSRFLLNLCAFAHKDDCSTTDTRGSSVYLTSELQTTQYLTDKGLEGLSGPYGTTYRSFRTSEGLDDVDRKEFELESFSMGGTQSISEYASDRSLNPGPSSA